LLTIATPWPALRSIDTNEDIGRLKARPALRQFLQLLLGKRDTTYTDDNDPDHTVCCHPIIVTYPLVNGDPVPTYTCYRT
ncbi:unnamed protein product, partial [Rotaria sp. Silwood1]